ncbi:hypothetical protein V461_05690 [Pantoea ananatis BRT98]|nr:hypothetical protein V461_05690 [Pantoea ananatis BRT98]
MLNLFIALLTDISNCRSKKKHLYLIHKESKCTLRLNK